MVIVGAAGTPSVTGICGPADSEMVLLGVLVVAEGTSVCSAASPVGSMLSASAEEVAAMEAGASMASDDVVTVGPPTPVTESAVPLALVIGVSLTSGDMEEVDPDALPVKVGSGCRLAVSLVDAHCVSLSVTKVESVESNISILETVVSVESLCPAVPAVAVIEPSGRDAVRLAVTFGLGDVLVGLLVSTLLNGDFSDADRIESSAGSRREWRLMSLAARPTGTAIALMGVAITLTGVAIGVGVCVFPSSGLGDVLDAVGTRLALSEGALVVCSPTSEAPLLVATILA